jgi:hypothetical protein
LCGGCDGRDFILGAARFGIHNRAGRGDVAQGEETMTKTIYKYTIPIQDEFELELPKGAQILSVNTQYDIPQIWCLLALPVELEKRKFRLAGTGHAIEGSLNLVHIGTFQLSNGALVFHLFEIKPDIQEPKWFPC